MRTVTALAVALAAAVALPANAAPRGVTFTDATGDANGLDGANSTGSQASFDIVKVWLGPHLPTKDTSGVTIRIELAAAPSTAPGSSFVFTPQQFGCDITASRTFGADGSSSSAMTICGTRGVLNSGTNSGAITITGKSVIISIPAAELVSSRRGSGISNIEVSTAMGEPVAGTAAPAEIDRAVSGKVYRVGTWRVGSSAARS